jgi:hypothetical protein
MRWNETSQAMQFGYYCGCSGCTQGCWNSAPGATPRDPNGRFDCSAPAPGTLPPFPKANKYWPYWFTGPNFEANGNPNSTATDACNDPRYGGGANNFPYPICKGRTAAFGEEWGTMDSDFTCKTYNSLVVDSPSFFCTTSPADKTAFPPPPAVSVLLKGSPLVCLRQPDAALSVHHLLPHVLCGCCLARLPTQVSRVSSSCQGSSTVTCDHADDTTAAASVTAACAAWQAWPPDGPRAVQPPGPCDGSN